MRWMKLDPPKETEKDVHDSERRNRLHGRTKRLPKTPLLQYSSEWDCSTHFIGEETETHRVDGACL